MRSDGGFPNPRREAIPGHGFECPVLACASHDAHASEILARSITSHFVYAQPTPANPYLLGKEFMRSPIGGRNRPSPQWERAAVLSVVRDSTSVTRGRSASDRSPQELIQS